MRRNLPIALAMLVLTALACNMLVNREAFELKTGPTETFPIAEPASTNATVTNARLSMAPSSAKLALAGGANGLVEGEIRYNVAEWEPTVSTSDDTLSILQELPDNKIGGISGEGVNEWDLKLGDELLNVRVECPAGDFTLDFADSLADGIAITIQMGAGNLRLVVPEDIAASLEVTRGPSTVSTEGAWTKNGSSYINEGTGSAWTIELEMGVGNLTLVSQ